MSEFRVSQSGCIPGRWTFAAITLWAFTRPLDPRCRRFRRPLLDAEGCDVFEGRVTIQ